MSRLLVPLLIVVTLLLEVGAIVALAECVRWQLLCVATLLTMSLGMLGILIMPVRWKQAIAALLNLSWVDPRVAEDAGNGILYGLACLLLIIPGLLTDLAGLLLGIAMGIRCWRHATRPTTTKS